MADVTDVPISDFYKLFVYRGCTYSGQLFFPQKVGQFLATFGLWGFSKKGTPNEALHGHLAFLALFDNFWPL